MSFFSSVAGTSDSKSGIDWESKSWMKDYEMALVTNETLEEVVTECVNAGKYGLDLETTGLDARVFSIKTEVGVVRRTRDVIVGVCLAPAGIKKGYYIPLRHRSGTEHNVSYSRFVIAFKRLVESEAVAVFHNGKFDQEFLEFSGDLEPLGTFDEPKKWDDTMILAYLRDPKQKYFGLKRLSKEELGKEMIELGELFPPETKKKDFSLLDPSKEGVVEYACSDAICTVELEAKLRAPALTLKLEDGKPHTQNVIYAIEKMCITSTRWMERSRLHINRDSVAELIQLAQVETITSLDKMYEAASKVLDRDITPVYHYLLKQRILEVNPELVASENPEHRLKKMLEDSRADADRLLRLYHKNDLGVRKRAQRDPDLEKLLLRPDPGKKDGIALHIEYDIMSSQKLGVLLHDLGVPNLKKTDSGQIATDKGTMDRILQDKAMEKKFPFLSLVAWFRENQNAQGKLEALFEDTHKEDNSLWVKFKNLGTDTGRFASPGDKKYLETGGTRFNLQSMPATYDPNRPPSLLRLRECIAARPGKFMVAVDFSGVELRIVSNLSLESKWVDAFFSCSNCKLKFDRGDGSATPPAPPKYCPICGSDKIGDIHTMTAIAIYTEKAPERPDWKQLRGNAKATNFALCYGGSGKAVVRSTGCSENEGTRIKRQFDATYKELAKWWAVTKKSAAKFGYVRTAFGRQYPVPDIKHEDGFLRSKAERNSINAPIQGTSADITKLAMGRLYRTCKQRGWLDKVLMVATMHDELLFEIDYDILEEALDVIVNEMSNNSVLKKLNWAVPLTVDIEIGTDWTVPWSLYKIQHLVGLRRELENPDLTSGEIKGILKRLLESMSKEKIKKKGLEGIDWPEPLKPYFKGADQKISEEGKIALKKAQEILFGNSPEEGAPPIPTGSSSFGGSPSESPQSQASSEPSLEVTNLGSAKFQLPEVLSIELAFALASAMSEAASKDGCTVFVSTGDGVDLTPEGLEKVDLEAFKKKWLN